MAINIRPNRETISKIKAATIISVFLINLLFTLKSQVRNQGVHPRGLDPCHFPEKGKKCPFLGEF